MMQGLILLKYLRFFLGDNISKLASTLNYDETIGVDIWGGAFIKQNDGSLFSEIAFGFDHYYQCNIELWGSRGKTLLGESNFYSTHELSSRINH